MSQPDPVHIVPVILAGGGGTRLWPLSREHYPKQFLSFADEPTLLQKTMARLSPGGIHLPKVEIGDPLIICNNEHRFLVAEQSQQIELNNRKIILEPVGRNTAPALTVAALAQDNKDSILVMMPADHVIEEGKEFYKAVGQAVSLAAEGYIVALGVKPQRPETGFGYIHHGTPLKAATNSYRIQSFTEKPDLETAEKFVGGGDYSWNSGIFIMSTRVWLQAVEQLAPSILTACLTALEKATADLDFIRLDEEAFSACLSDSIDYAVMEKLGEVPDIPAAVVSMQTGWSDVGSWNGYWEIMDKDSDGNVLRGECIAVETRNSVINSGYRLVTALGVQDLVVVETADTVLVTSRQHAQDVKKLVGTLQAAGRSEYLQHRRVYRPWGSYESIDDGTGFQVKRLTVKPGQKLSLQMHHHRAEHWVVVRGKAEVTRGEEVFTLTPNQSTYIPVGVKHRLACLGDEQLEVIEVQSGDYLGEDDIVRFEDVYNRD
jgi:mannose-1-phosphate guanylyltransferase/mannose-6-phosphate isomerase